MGSASGGRPYALVWTPIPIISWLMPFIGHLGVCASSGRTYDFAGPYTVNEDDLLFGRPMRRWVGASAVDTAPELVPEALQRCWDQRLAFAAATYRLMPYNLLTTNCHCFVAHFLNEVGYRGGGWHTVHLAALVCVSGRHVSLGALLYTWLPWLLLVTLGPYYGGTIFMWVYLGLCGTLTAWFFFYNYCIWRDLSFT
eukprot:XP_001693906.1 hypothetical protein CHLREDRAFT_129827 [Chlamydomonas reinhardtii]